MREQSFRKIAVAFFILLGLAQVVSAQTDAPAKPAAEHAGKEVLLPERITRVPSGNDFNNPDSEFCYKHSKSSDNLVLFWAKEYGDDPEANAVQNRRFNPDTALKECERFYDYYTDTLKWVDKEKSLAAKYKFLIFVIGGNGGTAFGGSIDNKIGALWTPATRINRQPYGVIAHELGHSFQAIGRADGAASFTGGSIHEMTSQYMLWQVYPEWMTFENYHLNDFHEGHAPGLSASKTTNITPPTCSNTGPTSMASNSSASCGAKYERGEDPVMTYKRLTSITQEQFNDEIFDAARRFVTWDMPRIEKVAARYANQHTTSLTKADDGWYQIAADKCPQNYGYNAIKLKGSARGDQNHARFQRHRRRRRLPQHQDRQSRLALWLPRLERRRHAHLQRHILQARGHGRIHGARKHQIPLAGRQRRPTEHWIHVAKSRGNAGGGAESNEQWPYRIKLTGTAPDESIVH